MSNEQKTMSKDKILETANQYAHEVYKLTRMLPKEELFGITSQLRRAALSVPLNLVEGHARGTGKNRANFSRIAYASLKESQYLLEFIVKEGLLEKLTVSSAAELGENIARMLWAKIKTMEKK